MCGASVYRYWNQRRNGSSTLPANVAVPDDNGDNLSKVREY